MAARSKKHTNKNNLTALASDAVAYLSKAQELLPLDDDMIVRDRKAANGLVQFPTEALATTVAILEAEPGLLPQFSIGAARDALAYDVALKKVITHAEALVVTLQRSLVKRRGAGVQQSLALYSWLKRLSRTDGSVVKYVEALAPHVVLHRRKKKATKADANATASTSPSPVTVKTTATEPAAITPPATPAPGAAVVTNGASAPATAH